MKLNLDEIKAVLQIVQSLFTTVALLIGGIWSYTLFIRKRQQYPRAVLKHSITHKAITAKKSLLHISVTISNPGEVLLSLDSGEIRLQQILPGTPELIDYIERGGDPVKHGETEIEFPLIALREFEWRVKCFEVEPGESEEVYYDFIIDTRIRCIEIYSYYRNRRKRGRQLGWHLTTIHDLETLKQ